MASQRGLRTLFFTPVTTAITWLIFYHRPVAAVFAARILPMNGHFRLLETFSVPRSHSPERCSEAPWHPPGEGSDVLMSDETARVL